MASTAKAREVSSSEAEEPVQTDASELMTLTELMDQDFKGPLMKGLIIEDMVGRQMIAEGIDTMRSIHGVWAKVWVRSIEHGTEGFMTTSARMVIDKLMHLQGRKLLPCKVTITRMDRVFDII